MSALDDLNYRLGHKLEQIQAMLPPTYKLTLVARHSTMPPGQNADIIMTNDALDLATEAIARHPSMTYRPADPPIVRGIAEISS